MNLITITTINLLLIISFAAGLSALNGELGPRILTPTKPSTLQDIAWKLSQPCEKEGKECSFVPDCSPFQRCIMLAKVGKCDKNLQCIPSSNEEAG